MDNPGTPGLRLLSLDGGGIRGLSMLIILKDLMWKLKVAEDLPDVPLPCDYFDLIGGTSTGRLIALMLGRLRMSIKDAVKAYGELSKEVFLDVKSQGSDGRFKASKLEKTIKGIVGTHSASQDPEEGMEDIRENPCKTSVQRIPSFVCAMNAANMSLPVLFRTFNTTNNPAMDCTIWQAGRATSAAPTFFKQIRIGPPGIEEAFIDGGMGQNNPIAALLLEAQVMFPDRQIACIISLGTGQPHTIKLPKPSLLKRVFPLDIIEAIKGIATDCEKQHQLSAHHFDPVPHVYFRFNVEQGMQDIQLNQWERLGDVAANTRQYLLSHPTQNQLVDAVKSLVEKIGRVSTQRLNAVPTAFEFEQFNSVLALVRCPPPSLIFQGRQDILAKMDQYFSEDIGERHTYVLHGLGGSGKTEIALKFLHMTNRHQAPRFTKQFFINASSLQTLDTALKNIAISHKVGKSSEDGLLWLITQRDEWILLFDDADNPSIDLFHFFPKCTHGNIIITSRNPQLAVHGPRSHSKVRDMNETDAIDLLLLSAVQEKPIESTQSASEIVKKLSCLPLAVIQAGAYISKFDCLHRYLSIYSQNRAKLLSQHPVQSHDDYRWTVYTTWQISFRQLSKAAARFLQLCSLLHHDSIPEIIFERAAKSSVYGSGRGAQTLQEARKFLQNFLVYSDSGRFKEAESLEAMVLEKQKQMLGADHPATLLAMGDLAATYCELGRYQDAEPLQGNVLEKRKQQLGSDHPDTLSAMANLARTYRKLGRYQEAEPLESIVLEKRKQVLGADHPDTLLAMESLAATYRELGRYQEAESLESIVLEKRKQILDADHPDTLANTYCKLGRYQEAEPLENTVLEKRKHLLGADHPDTLIAMANLATTYNKLGRYEEGEPLESIVLEKRKQLLGADHPDTLRAMANLAATYYKLGRYKEAEPLESIVLEKRKQVLGADHPHTLLAMRNLAATYRKLGRYQEAEYLQAQYHKLVGIV
ncbi:acyl transferase/acyl hydrolase/lysophospholipase [Mycena leptocephala]|nr:acyl transferase/acyl hydrolase/lysophospholipase [Mycena leptocephala]